MITLIRNVHVYAPADLGRQDLLLAGGRIARIAASINLSGDDVHVIDGSDLIAAPGFVDSLVHIIGGGGEGGFRTRTPELAFESCVRAGVTTLVGVLGTDAVTRTHSNLLAKAAELNEAGLSCYCHTGSYQVPARTLLSGIQEDLILIDRFIGVGEVAIADHRSSQPTLEEFRRLAADARIGGMLSGKAGIVSVHVGDAADGLAFLDRLLAESDLPITQFYPTHINRNRRLFADGIAYAKRGGYIDFTTSTTPQLLATGEVKAARALREALDAGVPLSQITFSSDANASLPLFDEAGQFRGLGLGDIASLFDEVRAAVRDEAVDLASALAVISENPARILQLPDKGCLRAGADADVVLLDAQQLRVRGVIAGGRPLMMDGVLQTLPVFA